MHSTSNSSHETLATDDSVTSHYIHYRLKFVRIVNVCYFTWFWTRLMSPDYQLCVCNFLNNWYSCSGVHILTGLVIIQVQGVVSDQTTEWSAMVSRQLLDEHTLLKSHIEQQNELLTRLMQESRETQMKELEARHDRQVIHSFIHSFVHSFRRFLWFS